MAEATGKSVIASGGISSLEDLVTLTELETSGIIGAIVGKAIYTNRFTVKEALERGAWFNANETYYSMS